MTLSAGTTLAVAIALTSCNNAEQVKKQVDEQNAKIQTEVDAKLNGLQDQVNTECAAKVDSLATAAYTTWKEEEAKAAKKGGKKPAPKPKAKEEPKKDNKGTVTDRKSTEQNIQDNKVTDRKSTEQNVNQNKVTDRKSRKP